MGAPGGTGHEEECLGEAAENDDLRRKYLDNLRSLERDEQVLRGREQELRRLVGKLCLAAQGQSPRLDAALRKLRDAVRGEVDSDQLEALGGDVAASVRELDIGTATLSKIDPQAATGSRGIIASGATTREARVLPGEAILGDERIRAVLARLLTELRPDQRLAEAVVIIDRELSISMTQEQLPRLIERVGGLLVQRIHGLERAREELQLLLDQMLGQLDLLSRFVSGHDLDESGRRSSSETLNTQISGEVLALGSAVDTGTDLATVRRQLRARLDSISRHLQEYHAREDERSRQARERTDQMRARMEELERETRNLHASLADEKRQYDEEVARVRRRLFDACAERDALLLVVNAALARRRAVQAVYEAGDDDKYQQAEAEKRAAGDAFVAALDEYERTVAK
jgi:diguanylate cyclase